MFTVLTLMIVAAQQPAEQTTGSKSADHRAAVILLEKGPLVLRMRVTLDGRPISVARKEYIDELIRLLDADGDGKLIRKETVRSPFLSNTGIATGNAGFFDVFRNRQDVPRKEVEQAINNIGGGVVDHKLDRSVAVDDEAVFGFLDGDGSKSLGEEEWKAASEKLVKKDIDGDGCVTMTEILANGTDRNALLRPAGRQRGNTSGSSVFIPLTARDAGERLLRKYDRNNDKVLSPDELGRSAEPWAKLDRNSDGKLDAAELARVRELAADLYVAARLGKRKPGQDAVEILACTGKPIDDAMNPSAIGTFDFRSARVSVRYSEVDPEPDSLANAQAALDRLDGNKDGYLEPSEVTFQFPDGPRSLMAMDADGDGKVFRDELMQYVTLRAQPAATSCHVLLIDRGYGFFRIIDRNGDGKISERELRMSAASLSSIDHEKDKGIAPSDPVQRVELEFSRGSFTFLTNFRTTGRNDEASDPPQRTLAGPVWFQRMDRNTDGDVSWNEFLGPRENFDELDADKDGLIDADEASRAGP